MNDTPTPRTDAAEQIRAGSFIGSQSRIVTSKFARTLEIELTSVTEQRDRLAEALREVATYDPSDGQCNSGYSCKYIAEKALQSLTPND
jgi:hypothetical protein